PLRGHLLPRAGEGGMRGVTGVAFAGRGDCGKVRDGELRGFRDGDRLARQPGGDHRHRPAPGHGRGAGRGRGPRGPGRGRQGPQADRQYLIENKLVMPAQMAAANAIEFGMPLFDISAMDPAQTAIKMVSEELVRKHCALPLFKRGKRLFVGIADPTNTRALDDFKFQTNLTIEAILVDEDRIKAAIDRWLE